MSRNVFLLLGVVLALGALLATIGAIVVTPWHCIEVVVFTELSIRSFIQYNNERKQK